jgi:ATP-binding cassette subfamily C protein
LKYWFDIGSAFVLSFILYIALAILAMPTAEVLVLLFLFARILPRVSDMEQRYQQVVHGLPAITSILRMQKRCEAAVEPRTPTRERIDLRDSIRLEGVSFGYEATPFIRDLNLTIRAGETTAIVGPSGAGKSTIADLLIGLITPCAGHVLVDGIPLGPERMRSWRNKIGYVAQDTFLFHDTVRANLLWAHPEATEEELSQALRLAAAEEFVSGLPCGLDAVVGDRGVRLSGGERQRLALARALLRKPSLLLLDEATSALDSENEQRVQRDLEKLHGRMTILIISHRLSTVRGADIIHVLENGRLVESGTWETLVTETNGRFSELCRVQGVDRDAGEQGEFGGLRRSAVRKAR